MNMSGTLRWLINVYQIAGLLFVWMEKTFTGLLLFCIFGDLWDPYLCGMFLVSASTKGGGWRDRGDLGGNLASNHDACPHTVQLTVVN